MIVIIYKKKERRKLSDASLFHWITWNDTDRINAIFSMKYKLIKLKKKKITVIKKKSLYDIINYYV